MNWEEERRKRPPDDPLYSEEYSEWLASVLGEAKAEWAKLPRAERERELTQLHLSHDTPDDLDPWPPELGGGTGNP
jgi:hypothetical protein